MPGFLRNGWVQFLALGAIFAVIGILGANVLGWGAQTSPKPSIKAETLFTLGPFHITNSILMMLLVGVILVIFFALMTRRMQVVPGRGQNLAEMAVESMLGLTEGVAGKRTGRVIFPLIATLFIFIILANYLALFPGVGAIGLCEKETAATEATSVACPAGTTLVPFLRAPNADLNMTVAMALIAVTIVQIAGVISHGAGGYVKELCTPGFLGPVHVIGELSRVISLSARLFGNIFGGEVLLLVMYYLFGSLFIGFGVFIFLGLELLFGFIQALLFSMLTLTYITLAVSGHGSGDDNHADAGAHGADTSHIISEHPAGAEVHTA